jgi:hypothetical protein
MTVEYRVTPELRTKFKEPFGILIKGEPNQTINAVKELIEKEKPSRLISVGDIVSSNLHENNVHPQLTIIDKKYLRKKTAPEEEPVEKTVYVNNPQGTITQEAINAIRDALEKKEHTHIVVKGEEDLLVLIAVLYAPENAFVVYGQPYSGIVLVKATLEKKGQAREFLNVMKASKS